MSGINRRSLLTAAAFVPVATAAVPDSGSQPDDPAILIVLDLAGRKEEWERGLRAHFDQTGELDLADELRYWPTDPAAEANFRAECAQPDIAPLARFVSSNGIRRRGIDSQD